MNIKHHLFGFLMAVLTLILYISLSVTSAAKSKIDDAKNYIGSISSFADQLDIKQLSDYLTEEVPELKTFLENENLSEEMKNKLDEMLSMNLNTKEKKDMIQSYISDSFAGSIDKPVKKTWWTLLLLLIFVQAAYWTTMFYLANRKSKRVNSASTYRSDDYIL